MLLRRLIRLPGEKGAENPEISLQGIFQRGREPWNRGHGNLEFQRNRAFLRVNELCGHRRERQGKKEHRPDHRAFGQIHQAVKGPLCSHRLRRLQGNFQRRVKRPVRMVRLPKQQHHRADFHFQGIPC